MESPTGNHPIISVTWYDAVAYAEWVGKRLPTLEERQLAGLSDQNHSGDRGGNPNSRTYYEVGSLNPNHFGLYEMVENVDEWIEDWYIDQGDLMLVKEGLMKELPLEEKLFQKGKYIRKLPPNYRSYEMGFRCVVGEQYESVENK